MHAYMPTHTYIYVTPSSQRLDIFYMKFLEKAKEKCPLHCLSHCLATNSFRKFHTAMGTELLKGALPPLKVPQTSDSILLIERFIHRFKGVLPCQEYAIDTSAAATNQIPLVRFPACFAAIHSLELRPSHWPLPLSPPFTSLFMPVYNIGIS